MLVEEIASGPAEAAIAEAAVELVGADPQHHQIHMAVAIDIERVGAGYAEIMRRRVAERLPHWLPLLWQWRPSLPTRH